MSDYHVLQSSPEGHQVTIAVHFAVPDENNAAGVKLRTALRQHQPFTGSAVPGLEDGNPTEYASLQSGATCETVVTVGLDGNLSDVAKLAYLDAQYGPFTASELTRLRAILRYWGYAHNVS
ncbi:MAG: hypothetical protein WC907_01485 [Acholeplasmataceae bacterium]